MFGLPFDAWVLLFCGVGLGLTLEGTFYLARRRDAGGRRAEQNDAGPRDGRSAS